MSLGPAAAQRQARGPRPRPASHTHGQARFFLSGNRVQIPYAPWDRGAEQRPSGSHRKGGEFWPPAGRWKRMLSCIQAASPPSSATITAGTGGEGAWSLEGKLERGLLLHSLLPRATAHRRPHSLGALACPTHRDRDWPPHSFPPSPTVRSCVSLLLSQGRARSQACSWCLKMLVPSPPYVS